MASSDPPFSLPLSRNLQHLKALIPLYISKTNAHIAHLNRLTASTSHLDTLLSTLTYTLTLLLHSPLPLPPLSLTSLTTLLTTTRTTLRLLGLLQIHTWALSPPSPDPILRAFTTAQVVACAVYQSLENAAFLAERGVLRGWGGEKMRRWGRWSCRAWMVYVGLEGGRLVWERWGGEEWGVEREGDAEGMGEKEEKIQRKIQRERMKEKWWRQAVLNAAYAPMTLHWSVEGGVLSEPYIGALGLVAGVVGFRQAWRETA